MNLRLVFSSLTVLAAMQAAPAAPHEVTFKDYLPNMGFKLSGAKLEDSDVILYSLYIENSIGRRSGVALELFHDNKLIGHLDLLVIDMQDTPGYMGDSRRLAVFSISTELSRQAMLYIRRDEKEFKEPLFKLPLSSWPVKTVHAKK